MGDRIIKIQSTKNLNMPNLKNLSASTKDDLIPDNYFLPINSSLIKNIFTMPFFVWRGQSASHKLK